MRFFVSYSRSVKEEVRKVVDLLRANGHEVWWDADIPVMADWWATILGKIEWCNVFIFVISEQSVKSAFCLAELDYASDKQRPVVPFILDKNIGQDLPKGLPPRGQWLVYDGNPAEMLNQINTACKEIKWEQHKDLDIPRPPEPLTGGKSIAVLFQEAYALANTQQFEEAKDALKNIKRVDYGRWGDECDKWLEKLALYESILELTRSEVTKERARENWIRYIRKYGSDFDPAGIAQLFKSTNVPMISYLWVMAVVVVVLMGIGLLVVANQPKQEVPVTPSEVASVGETPTDTEVVTENPSPPVGEGQGVRASDTPTDEPTLTPTGTPDVVAAAMQVIQEQTARAVIDQATATSAQATQEESLRLTQNANLTETATLWTKTPTPDITATINAILTQWFLETATQSAVNATATATLWTKTPTPTPTSTPTPTPTPTKTPLERARSFNGTKNADWVPFEQTFEDGVPMVLVPAGCFQMGSNSGDSDEQPVHEQCFEVPFWIDKFEVSQGDFERLGGKKARDNYFSGETLPVEQITWFEAQAFCELRGMRLPTEREWEYAARGVESLVYPWGNDFVGENVVYRDNSGSKTASVGSRPGGASWVGGMDFSGNVWEWVLSEYKGYPYEGSDGREENLSSTSVRRGLRGGSWGNNSAVMRSAYRLNFTPGDDLNYIGARCVRFLP